MIKASEINISDIKVGPRFREQFGDIEDLAETIKQHGIIQPLTVDTTLTLVAGGRRLRAAEVAGLKKVPVIIRKVANEIDAREIELIENLARKELTWQEQAKLQKRIHDLKCEQDPNWSKRKTAELTEVGRGASDRNISLAVAMEVIPALGECGSADEAWKKLQRFNEARVVQELAKRAKEKSVNVPRLALADGNYNIGNAIKKMADITDEIFGFAEVDPPYAIDLHDKRVRTQDDYQLSKYSEVDIEKYPQFLKDTAEQVYRLLMGNTFCVWWFGCSHYDLVKTTLVNTGFKVSEVPAIWFKGEQGQTNNPDTTLASCYEPFFICRKGRPVIQKKGRSNVFEFSPVVARRKIHPTERPIELMLELLDVFVWPDSSILSPFLGSGAILRAAYKRDMVGCGWELDEELKHQFIARVQEDIENEQGEDTESSN